MLRTVKLRVKVNYDVHSALEEVEREYRDCFGFLDHL